MILEDYSNCNVVHMTCVGPPVVHEILHYFIWHGTTKDKIRGCIWSFHFKGIIMCFMYVVECVAACILALHPSALCIVYFHLHCALIFTPNEIMPKSPKVLTASGLKSQSPQDLVWKQTIVFIVLLIPPLHPPSAPSPCLKGISKTLLHFSKHQRPICRGLTLSLSKGVKIIILEHKEKKKAKAYTVL